MRRFSLLLTLAAGLCAAQTAVDLESEPVNRVAKKLACTCGCAQDMTCQMEPGCGICKRAKTKIFAAQQSGKSDTQILDEFAAENGHFTEAPDAGFCNYWLVNFAGEGAEVEEFAVLHVFRDRDAGVVFARSLRLYVKVVDGGKVDGADPEIARVGFDFGDGDRTVSAENRLRLERRLCRERHGGGSRR